MALRYGPSPSIMETFKQDPRDHKVNLSIGLYYNEAGIIPQLQAVGFRKSAPTFSAPEPPSVWMEAMRPACSIGCSLPNLQTGPA
jgi:hypothetical protein